MKVKEDKVIFTNSFWYDLLDGVYFSPSDLLEEGAEEVDQAIEVLLKFRNLLEKEGVIEEM